MSAAPYWTVQMIPLAINPVAINPASLPNLLWWDDVASLAPQADGTAIAAIPVFPGTPTVSSGVNLKLAPELGGSPVYRAGVMPSGAPVADFRGNLGPSMSHQGVAFTTYAQNTNGMTLYYRWWQYPPQVGRTSVRYAFSSVSGINILGDAITDPTFVHTFVDSGNIAPTFSGIADANLAHTMVLTIPRTGTFSAYLDGQLQGTQTSGAMPYRTDSDGRGWAIGESPGNNTIDTSYGLSATIMYGAIHDAKTIKGVSQWLAQHR